MNYNLNFGLKGEYKVDLYSGKKLVETIDWFSNDITNVGLTYPLNYSFAQCFMFLSLGESQTPQGENKQFYTGLVNPIKTFKVSKLSNGILSYINQSGQYIGWPGYEIGDYKTTSANSNSSTTCGTRVTDRGLRLYRGWTIPTGDSSTEQYSMGESLNIKQLMVSPSSGSDAKGNKAFSIVDRDILIPSGYSATITYQLSIDFENFKLPYTFFSGKNVPNTNGFFDTGKAITGINGSNELELLSGWSNLSGIFRQILPGIQLVDSFGACFIQDKMGADMEPSKVDCRNTNFYLSADMSQFAISKSGKYGSDYEAYNSNGLCMNYFELLKENEGNFEFSSLNANGGKAYGANGGDKWFYSGFSQLSTAPNPYEDQFFQKIKNIRLENLLNIQNYKTGSLTLNYLTNKYTGAKNFPVAFATPGKIGFDNSLSDFGQKIVLSTNLKRMPIDPTVLDTGNRTKYVTKKAIIPPINCYGHNSRYGSLVLGYAYSKTSLINTYSFSPYFDFLFFDNEGRGANMAHYKYIPTIYLKDRGTGIAKVRFDIVYEDNSKPESINRFYSVYGFMGSGVSTTINSSGLDTGHSYLANTIVDTNSKFIPIGNKTSGFLFPGQTLDINVPGNKSYNNNTGYGAVYGVIANSGFYLSPYDLCLLDVPNWSGLGTISNEISYLGFNGSTGFSGNLCWPNYSRKISLKLNELEYYIPGIGNFQDSNSVIGKGKIIYDITGSNFSLFNPETFGTNKIWLASGDDLATPFLMTVINNLKPRFLFSGNSKITSGIMNFSGYSVAGTQYAVFYGFSNFPLSERRAELNYSNDDIKNLLISGEYTYNGNSQPLKLRYGSNINSPVLQYSNLKCVPDILKSPEAYIYHIESTGNNDGYRLLPNYSLANTGNINTYLPITGGSFPGLSTENGMDLYLTISWTGA